MNIHKTCLDEVTFSSFMDLLSLKDKKLFSDKINDILDNSWWFMRADGIDRKNPQWEKLIYKQEQLSDNFDLVYASYYFDENEKGITYDFNVLLKCKTMPFVARFLFDTEPENFSDKNDLDIFPDIQSTLSFFNAPHYKDNIEKSLNDYEILQRHLAIENQLSNKKEMKALKI
jgi:hypothetical protein